MPESLNHKAQAKTSYVNGRVRKKRRGATGLKDERADWLRTQSFSRGLVWLFNVVPWRQGFVHAGIFSFWLVLITSLLQGAKWIDRPIAKIEVLGDFEQIQHSAIQQELAILLKNSFFTLDLNAIQSQLQSKAWVKKAEVERLWPDLLRVELEEERAVAVWNNFGFLNASGDVLWPERLPQLPDLPKFYGDVDQAVTMLKTYHRWSSKLARVNLSMASLRITRREAWQVGFDGDWLLSLGKDNVEQRLQRFIEVYGKRLYQDVANIQAVDARYTQGVSVAWKVPPVAPAQG